jgi:hypothetical protein
MKSVFTRFLDSLLKYGLEHFGLYYGEYDGVCVDNEDPSEQGRIKVKVPGVAGRVPIGDWAWPTSLWSGRDSGFFVVPDVGDPVTVTFRNGNPSYPKYTGGSWPKVGGNDNFTPKGYVDGSPVIRMFRTKSGHELAFCDNPEDRYCHFLWNSGDDDGKVTHVTIDKDGSVLVENHKGGVLEMTALEDDENVNRIQDDRGNFILQDKDGTIVQDHNGNKLILSKDLMEVTGSKNFRFNGEEMDVQVKKLKVEAAGEEAVRGTTWFDWFVNTFLKHYLAHTHGTGVGPSGPPMPPPLQMPVKTDVLTNKVLFP